MIHIAALNLGVITIKTNGGERTESHPPHPNFHEPLIDNFADAVINGREPAIDGESGRYVSKLIEEIYERGA